MISQRPQKRPIYLENDWDTLIERKEDRCEGEGKAEESIFVSRERSLRPLRLLGKKVHWLFLDPTLLINRGSLRPLIIEVSPITFVGKS